MYNNYHIDKQFVSNRVFFINFKVASFSCRKQIINFDMSINPLETRISAGSISGIVCTKVVNKWAKFYAFFKK